MNGLVLPRNCFVFAHPNSEIYPFMVVIIGLENILIIVKAVMSTPEELEVKYRIAAGLAKEGQAITQSLLSLLFILTMGIIFFNYTLKVGWGLMSLVQFAGTITEKQVTFLFGDLKI